MRFPRNKWGARLALLFMVFGLMAVAASADTAPQLIPNDPGYTYNPGPLQQIDAPEAWAAVPCKPVTIAVLDTGVAPIADLTGRILPGWNAVDGSNNTADDYGHGTAVASVIAAAVNNGIGIAGICDAAQLLPVKIADSSNRTRADWATSGVNWAVANGAKVINLSFALDPGTSWGPLNVAVQNAVDHGITVVIGAGNNGSNDPSSDSIASSSPAAIRVAGVDANNALDPRSNHGGWTDIASPFIMSVDTPDGATGIQGGTSLSAPMVSGAAAMLLSYNPSLTPAQVKSLLMSGGTKMPGLDVGCGCILNVYGALQAAGYSPPPPPPPPTQMYKLVAAVSGKGSVACSPACSRMYASGTVVKLTAKPKSGWRFLRWGGDCAGTRTICRIELTANLRVIARFVLKPRKKK